ncbi:hypothetical protein [Amycolatopsis magusensis]
MLEVAAVMRDQVQPVFEAAPQFDEAGADADKLLFEVRGSSTA